MLKPIKLFVLLCLLGCAGALTPAWAEPNQIVNSSDKTWWVSFRLSEAKTGKGSVIVYKVNPKDLKTSTEGSYNDKSDMLKVTAAVRHATDKPVPNDFRIVLSGFNNPDSAKIEAKVKELRLYFFDSQKDPNNRTYLELTGVINDARDGFKKITDGRLHTVKDGQEQLVEEFPLGTLMTESHLAKGNIQILSDSLK